ncbi:unnamed protein product [Trifolium pratense]|uniref:Uncharacterized protein n=1 Tax=Trifolium pratense TaxID=57577 RepID=A0ACB0KCF9_TRIPR|nr:unnamed protein product [Trifolium pratense]
MAEYVKNIAEKDRWDRWEKMHARNNAAFDRIISKLEILLQHYNCSPSSSHGATNSPKYIPTPEPLNTNLLMHDEFRLSAKQIEVPSVSEQKLLQEEIVASKSVNETLLVSDTIVPSMAPIVNHVVTKDTALPSSDAFLPFLEPILEPESVCETKMVETVTPTCDVDNDVGKLAITESFTRIHGTPRQRDRRFTKIGLEVTTETMALISQHEPQDNESISEWLCTAKSPYPIIMLSSSIQTCLSHARRNVSMKSLLPKPPDWTYRTISNPPQPPAPPDQISCVVTTRFADHIKSWYIEYSIVVGTLGKIKNEACGTMFILYDENSYRYMKLKGGRIELSHGYFLVVYGIIKLIEALLVANEVLSKISPLDNHFCGFGEHGIAPDNVAMTNGVGNNVSIGEIATTLEITHGKSVCTGLLNAPSWTNIEYHSFLVVLNVFEKNIIFLKRLVGTKSMGDIWYFSYEKFCRSICYFQWTKNRKLKTQRRVCGYKIFTGWKQQKLLSSLFFHVSGDYHSSLVQLWRNFREENISIEEFVFALKVVSHCLLTDAMSIWKEKYYEAIIACRRASNDFRTHKGETRSSCSPWLDREYWYRIESHINDILMIWKDQLVHSFSDCYAHYGSIHKACDLFHDVQKKDMIAYYSAMTYNCEMNANMIDELIAPIVGKGVGLNYTTCIGIVIVVPLEDVAASLIQVPCLTYFYVAFTTLVHLLSVHTSIMPAVTNVEMVGMLGSWSQSAKLDLLCVHLIVFPWHSKKWDPGGLSFGTVCFALNLEVIWKYVAIIQLYSLVHKEGMLNLELTLGVTTLSQHLYLNFNLEDKVGFKGDGIVMRQNKGKGLETDESANEEWRVSQEANEGHSVKLDANYHTKGFYHTWIVYIVN